MRILCLLMILVLLGYGGFVLERGNSPTSEGSLKKLLAGNERFILGKSLYPDQTNQPEKDVASKHPPFAMIVSCSLCCDDSHLSPEVIFDQKQGDLAVIRVAGNIVGTKELEKIQFAAEQQRVSLILILGHQNCGAVRSVIEGNTESLRDLGPYILPALEKTKDLPGDPVENGIKAHIELVAEKLRNEPTLSKLIQNNQLDIQAGYYELASHRVELLPGL